MSVDEWPNRLIVKLQVSVQVFHLLKLSGDKYIIARKLKKTAIEDVYSTTDLQFYINSEDVRFVGMGFEEVQRKKSKRNQQRSWDKLLKLKVNELEALKFRCWQPLN